MDLIAKFVQKETRKIREYAEFVADTDIGELKISLKDHCIPRAGFRYAIEVNKGATSEFKPFLTRFFANRYFEKIKNKYEGTEGFGKGNWKTILCIFGIMTAFGVSVLIFDWIALAFWWGGITGAVVMIEAFLAHMRQARFKKIGKWLYTAQRKE